VRGGHEEPCKNCEEVDGKKIAGLWDEFVESRPDANKAAQNYGKPGNDFDADLLQLWKQALKDNLAKVEDRPTIVWESWEFTSPLDADLCEQWGGECHDPDECLPDFIRRGALYSQCCLVHL